MKMINTFDTQTIPTSFLFTSTGEQMNEACGGAEANGLSGAEGDGEEDGGGEEEEEEVPVDENLFTGEDLEELDEELNTLALDDWERERVRGREREVEVRTD